MPSRQQKFDGIWCIDQVVFVTKFVILICLSFAVREAILVLLKKRVPAASEIDIYIYIITLSLSRWICYLLPKKHSVMDLILKVWDVQDIKLTAFKPKALTTKKKSWKIRITF